MSRDE